MMKRFREIKDIIDKPINLIIYRAGGGRDKDINLQSFSKLSTAL